MSGLTAPGRGPDNDPELLAQMYADIQKLKRGEVLRAGEWSIYTDPETGNLMKSRPGRVEGVGTEAEPEITDLTAERGFILKDVANAIYEGVTQETIPADAPDKGLPDIRDVLSNIPAISVPDLIGGFAAIWNEWFDRSDGSGSVPELTYTIGAIKDAVINGYNVIGFSTSVAGYVVPMHVEARAILVGGGQNGLSGSTGGLHGSYLAQPLDLTGAATLDMQVGTAGNRSFIRVGNASPHTGVVIAESPLHGSPGGIGDVFGLVPTTSLPGSGGNGGNGGPGGTVATPGESTPFATGGTAGAAGNFGSNGGPGGSVDPDAKIKSGGAGGGGGGRANVVLNGGGNGGAGGWPGGGGGGSGAGWGGGPNGAVGPGAPGVIYFFYK
jgi:hypothetical protein